MHNTGKKHHFCIMSPTLRSSILIPAIIAILGFSPGNSNAQCQMGEEDAGVYKQMRFSMDNGLYGDAKIRAKVLITKYGNLCPELYYDAGWLSYMTESWWDTIEFMKLALITMKYSNQRQLFAYAAVGIAYYNVDYYSEAIQYLDKAISLESKADYYKYRGLAYYKLEDFDMALLNFQEAKKLGSEFNSSESDIFWDAASKIKER
jgi:tetratricopeptide (TPR) repeat protein